MCLCSMNLVHIHKIASKIHSLWSTLKICKDQVQWIQITCMHVATLRSITIILMICWLITCSSKYEARGMNASTKGFTGRILLQINRYSWIEYWTVFTFKFIVIIFPLFILIINSKIKLCWANKQDSWSLKYNLVFPSNQTSLVSPMKT